MRKSPSLKRLILLLATHPLLVGGIVLMSCIAAYLQLELPRLIGMIVDAWQPGVMQPEQLSQIAHLLFYGLLILLTGSLSAWGASLLSQKLVLAVVAHLRTKALEQLMSGKLSEVSQYGEGDVAQRISTDAETISRGLMLLIQQLPLSALGIIIALAHMIVLDHGSAVATALFVPVALLGTNLLVKASSRHFIRHGKIRGQFADLVDETCQASAVLARAGSHPGLLTRIKAISQGLAQEQRRGIFWSSTVNPLMRCASALVYAVVGTLGMMHILNGRLTVGSLVAFLAYVEQYGKPFIDISACISEIKQAEVAATRLFALCDLTQEVSVELTSDSQEERVQRASTEQESYPLLEIKDLTFGYSQDTPLLKGINLRIERPMTIALVGATGCGKTTLLGLLLRLYTQNSGELLYRGDDIRTIPLAEWRRLWGVIPQKSWLVEGTVFENIALGNPQATYAHVEAAARAARIHDVIEGFEHGYDTVIDAHHGLSEGQAQLICLARLWLLSPEFLIIDEATAHLDSRTEQRVLAALKELMETHCVFVVAHRLQTIISADRICLIEDGCIREMGTHQELLASNGAYKKLFEAQFSQGTQE